MAKGINLDAVLLWQTSPNVDWGFHLQTYGVTWYVLIILARYLSFARSVCHQWVCMHFILTLKFPIPRVTSRPMNHLELQFCQITSIICRTGINCLEVGLPKNRLPLHPLIIMFPIKNCHWSCGLISIFKHSQPQVWSTDLQLCDFGRKNSSGTGLLRFCQIWRMNIHKSQLFWCEQKGRILVHSHVSNNIHYYLHMIYVCIHI